MTALVCLAALLSAAATGLAFQSNRPYELEIQLRLSAESSAESCTFISLRETQVHKDLFSGKDELVSLEGALFDGEGIHKDQGGKFIRHFSYNTGLLWDTAVAQCGSSLSWSFPVYIEPGIHAPHSRLGYNDGDDQGTFIMDDSNVVLSDPVPAPPLEIIPLSTTGHSSNRIDFVFFGDGCKRFHNATQLNIDG